MGSRGRCSNAKRSCLRRSGTPQDSQCVGRVEGSYARHRAESRIGISIEDLVDAGRTRRERVAERAETERSAPCGARTTPPTALWKNSRLRLPPMQPRPVPEGALGNLGVRLPEQGGCARALVGGDQAQRIVGGKGVPAAGEERPPVLTSLLQPRPVRPQLVHGQGMPVVSPAQNGVRKNVAGS